MKYKIVFTPGAKEDLRDSSKWYNKQRTGFGKELVKRVRERAADIIVYPMSCQIRYREVHTALIAQFPFMLHYYVDDNIKTIYII